MMLATMLSQTDVVWTWLPACSPLVCLLGLLGIVLLGKWPNAREASTLVAGVTNLGIVIAMTVEVLGNGTILGTYFTEAAPGLTLAFRVDHLSLIFALVASTLWLINSIYAIGYMRAENEHAQTRFFGTYAVAISAAMGVAFSGNLFTMFVFYEVLTLSTYALVIHHEDHDAINGGLRYLTILLTSSVAFQLPGLVMVWVATGGNIEFGPEALLVAHRVPGISAPFLMVAFGLCIAGIGKAALMPFHGWLPAAMVAPTPVSAFLHAVAVVKAGVFTVAIVVLRVFGPALCHELGVDVVLGGVAGFTVIVASLVALRQDNLKRMLAYSTIGQLSYIVLGLSLCSALGIRGGLFHIAAHAFAKITLFFCAGAIFVATGKKYMSQMVGIGRRMPVTMGAFFIGTLGVIGLPPSGGFLSKWWLLQGTLSAGQWWLFLVFLVSSFLNACYFFPFVFRAFFCTDEESQYEAKVQEAPLLCVVPLVVTATISVVMFFFPDVFFNLAEAAATTAKPVTVFGGSP
jgi:multicomponent Na+:H+ antiporter subunit D